MSWTAKPKLPELANRSVPAAAPLESEPPTSHERSIWLLTVVLPLLFAAVRLIMVARGDAETLRSLVQNLNVAALVLATVLPLGSTVALWLLLVSFLAVLSKNVENRSAWSYLFVLLLVAAPLMVFYAMPLRHLVINAGILGLLILICLGYVVAKKKRIAWAARLFTFTGAVSLIAVLVTPAVLVLAVSGIWLPKERIMVSEANLEPVYVLSSDERWTTYLDDGHKVHG